MYPETSTENLEGELSDFCREYSQDVNSERLLSELCHLKQVHSANISPGDSRVKPIDLLNRITQLKLQCLFPNIIIAIRIFLTLPVTVATGERSFSKLSFIKNKLRNSSTQDMVVSLSMLSIECDLARQIDFDSVIDIFAQAKARRVPL